MTKKEYFGEWWKVIDKVELDKVLKVITMLYHNKIVFPTINNIFKAFRECSYENCKIVFVGQDPYPTKGYATGLCFANPIDTKTLSPSLQVLKEAIINFSVSHNNVIFDQTLQSIANQGVLFLNSALTVEENKIGSHSLLWRNFIAAFLKNMSEYNSGIIYVLFGSQAQSFEKFINNNNAIIKLQHPAYYARIGKTMPSDFIYELNKLIKEKYNITIKWYKELDYG